MTHSVQGHCIRVCGCFCLHVCQPHLPAYGWEAQVRGASVIQLALHLGSAEFLTAHFKILGVYVSVLNLPACNKFTQDICLFIHGNQRRRQIVKYKVIPYFLHYSYGQNRLFVWQETGEKKLRQYGILFNFNILVGSRLVRSSQGEMRTLSLLAVGPMYLWLGRDEWDKKLKILT